MKNTCYSPVPPEFAEQFIQHGWRHCERIYNARTDTITKWIHLCGGERVLGRDVRREIRRAA